MRVSESLDLDKIYLTFYFTCRFLDHQQITVTHALIAKLLENNVALITCDGTHHPTRLMLNLDGHTLQSQKFKAQLEATVPLKKQLWQQTVMCKISNQAALLRKNNKKYQLLDNYAKEVKSGDNENHEARAAAHYWKSIFHEFVQFRRDRYGLPPNNFLNYGYAILRAVVARNLVGSGLLPTLGIHHQNQYNAYCLADDIMEPYLELKIIIELVPVSIPAVTSANMYNQD